MNTQDKILDEGGVTFDDVLLVPNFAAFKREEMNLASNLTKEIRLDLPFLSSPMDTVTNAEMAIAMGKLGGLGVIGRNFTIEAHVREIEKAKKEIPLVATAVGIGPDLGERIQALSNAGIDIVVIDSAHGHSKWVIEATRFIAQKYKHLALISGSVATAAGAKALVEAGAAGLRVGMGPGSICTTRIVAGMGIPQISAIMETVKIAKVYGVPVIADGGIRVSGDIVKALASGASTVMMGSLLAGCDEAPGKIVTIKGEKFKSYRGMGSVAAMKAGSAVRYGQEYKKGQEKKLVAEGVEGLVPYKGRLEDIVNQLAGGLRTGMYYTGVQNIKDLQEKTRFIKISRASLAESYPHDIVLKSPK